jgi:DNA-binding NarL/FixJ family response regulator
MQTAFAVDLAEKTALENNFRDISVAISAESAAIRDKIEALAERSGAHLVAYSARYDVLLVAMDESASTALLKEVARPGKACAIWISGEPSRNTVLRILRAGMAGVLSLESTCEQFQAALRAIQAGLQVIHPDFTRTQSGFSSDISTNFSGEELTDREQQVLGMMAEGLSNKEISVRLAISAHTVKFHISSILGKLGAGSRTEAVSIGVRTGRVVI